MKEKESGQLARGRWRLWSIGMSALALVLGIYAALLHEQEKSEAELLNRNLTDTYAVLTGHLLDGVDALLVHAASGYFNSRTEERVLLESVLRRREASDPLLADVMLLDKKGEVIFKTAQGPNPRVSDHDCFLIHQNPRSGLYVSPPFYRKAENDWVFSLSRAHRDKNGKLIGVAFAVIDLKEIARQYARLPLQYDGSISLQSAKGEFMTRVPVFIESIAGKVAPSIKQISLPLKQSVNVVIPESISGGKRMAVLKPIEPYGLIVASTMDYDLVFSRWRAVVSGMAVLWIALGVAGWIFTGRFLRARQAEENARREREEQTRRNEERFALAANQTGQLIFECTPKNKKVAWVGAVEQMTGQSPLEFSGVDMTEFETLIHLDDRERFHDAFEQAAKERSSFELECRLRRADGRYIETEIRGSYLREGPGRIIGAISDISRRKEAQRALEAFNRRLEARVQDELLKRHQAEEKRQEQEKLLIQQSKMAAMGEMIGAIAHQWRQPLNSLGLYVQDIQDAWRYGELNNEYLEKMVEKSLRQIYFMSNTINDFRNFFKPDKLERRIELGEVAQGALGLVSAQLKDHGIEVRFETEGNPLAIMGYENELGQAILNLLSNAKDALDETKPENPLITLRLRSDTHEAVLEIEDNGGGIKPEILDRIFEPYFTTKEQGKGTGIGLYMSKMIIESNMHGRLTAQNTNSGALFTLRLPLTKEGA